LALFELGQDYLRAGLLDRAENLFTELLEQGEYRGQALAKLLDIYQQEKEWEKAIDIGRRLEHTSGRRMNTLIAQFYCELGDAARDKGDFRTAIKMAKRALGTDRQCVRASLLQAEVERTTGHCKAAVKSLQQVERQDPSYIPEVVSPLLACYQNLGKLEDGERYLSHLLDEYGGISPLLAIADLTRQRQGEQAASRRIVSFLCERPSVRGLDRLIELQLVETTGTARDNLLILRDLTQRLLAEKSPYRCHHCGFKAKSLLWHCPSCKEWATIRPIHGVVGE
jgi:lipopolysaccharide biosynthesis regulator YciM